VSEAAPLGRPLPELVVGDQIKLSRWRADMVDEVHAVVARSQPTLSAFLPWAAAMPSAADEAAAQATTEQRWREGRMVGWTLVEDGAIRGMVGLHRRGGPDELEIGYWLDDLATGRGLMTEAAAMATDVAFSVEGIDGVEIIHDAANHRSAGVPSRLGYRRLAAFTSIATARCESGIKVRWCMRREQWRTRPPTVRSMH
jgi:ribosomal-protein-serine acetyltransferase